MKTIKVRFRVGNIHHMEEDVLEVEVPQDIDEGELEEILHDHLDTYIYSKTDHGFEILDD